MNTPWALEEKADWPFDFTIKNAKNEVLFSLGRCAYSSLHNSLDDVYAALHMGENQAEAIRCNAEQKAMLDGVVRAVNSHQALIDALETLLGSVEGKHVTVGDCNQAIAALQLAKVEA